MPGIDPEAHPRDLSEGQRLGLALAVVLAPEPPVRPARRADPRSRLRGQGPADRRARAAWRPRATRSCSPPTTSRSWPGWPTGSIVLADGEVVADGPAREVVVHSPVFAPQVAKVLAPEPWLTVAEVEQALAGVDAVRRAR